MSRKSKGDVALVDEGPGGVIIANTDDMPRSGDASASDETPAGLGGNGKRLTLAQERQRAERLARRPRYWIMRLTGNGLPDSVVAILPSRATAERKVYEYASVLRASPDSLCVFRVSTPDGYRYPE